MTNDELKKILEILDVEYPSEPPMIYVFYRHPDGRIDNYAISFHQGKKLSDGHLVDMMRRSSPTLRQTEVLGVERPDWVPPVEWMDVLDVCRLLRVSSRTLRKWTQRGLFHPSQIGRRLYYSRDEVENVLRRNAFLDNGRIDNTVLENSKQREK